MLPPASVSAPPATRVTELPGAETASATVRSLERVARLTGPVLLTGPSTSRDRLSANCTPAAVIAPVRTTLSWWVTLNVPPAEPDSWSAVRAPPVWLTAPDAVRFTARPAALTPPAARIRSPDTLERPTPPFGLEMRPVRVSPPGCASSTCVVPPLMMSPSVAIRLALPRLKSPPDAPVTVWAVTMPEFWRTAPAADRLTDCPAADTSPPSSRSPVPAARVIPPPVAVTAPDRVTGPVLDKRTPPAPPLSDWPAPIVTPAAATSLKASPLPALTEPRRGTWFAPVSESTAPAEANSWPAETAPEVCDRLPAAARLTT